jgi:hypothetical protein
MHENQKKGGPRSRKASPWTFNKMFNESEYRGPTIGLGLEEFDPDGDDFNAGKSVAQKCRKYYGKEGRVPASILLRMREAAPPSGGTPLHHPDESIGAVAAREWLECPTRAAYSWAIDKSRG